MKTARHIKLIESKVMSGSLSSLADSLSEELHKSQWNNFKSRLEYVAARENTLKCVECNKNYEKEFDRSSQ